jgi:hypothetical protein
VRDISISPIEASDQEQMIKMMDEEEGVLLIRKHNNKHLFKLTKNAKKK